MAKSSPNILILVDGQALIGRALPKTYSLETEFGNFKVPAKNIAHIHFENGNPGGTDEIKLKSTSTLRGTISPDPLPFVVAETGDTMMFPQKKLHTLVFFFEP